MKHNKKDKYYTPKIEEFVVGFTCETTYALLSESEDWEKITFTEELLDKYLYTIAVDAFMNEFRVRIKS